MISDSSTRVSRRRFCGGACQAASGAALATLVSACSGNGSPTSPSAMASPVGTLAGRFAGSIVQATIAGSALASIGGAALVQSNAGVFLVSRTSETTFMAIDAVCTHEGCTITEAAGTTYVCPCHGSRYSRTGQVLGGPATAALRQYAATFADGVVSIAL